MLPQLGAGGCWPRPRNDRLASAITAAAMASVACTISGAVTFGSTWRSAIRPGGWLADRAPARCDRVVRRDPWRQQREHDEAEHQRQPEQRGAPAPEAPPRAPPRPGVRGLLGDNGNRDRQGRGHRQWRKRGL